MHPGTFKAYPRRQGAKAATATQGKGPEGSSRAGIVDGTTTVYKAHLNDTSQSRLAAFIIDAAAALSVNKSELIIEDSHGRQMLGESHENGTNVIDGVPRLK